MRILPFAAVIGLSSLALHSAAIACSPPPPVPPGLTAEEVARRHDERMLANQNYNWAQAQSIFIARVEGQGTVPDGPELRGGRRAVLVPLLQIKGPRSDFRKISIRHSSSLCGMSPDFDALADDASGNFVVYMDGGLTTGQVIATVRVDDLLDPVVREAWLSAYSLDGR